MARRAVSGFVMVQENPIQEYRQKGWADEVAVLVTGRLENDVVGLPFPRSSTGIDQGGELPVDSTR